LRITCLSSVATMQSVQPSTIVSSAVVSHNQPVLSQRSISFGALQQQSARWQQCPPQRPGALQQLPARLQQHRPQKLWATQQQVAMQGNAAQQPQAPQLPPQAAAQGVAGASPPTSPAHAAPAPQLHLQAAASEGAAGALPTAGPVRCAFAPQFHLQAAPQGTAGAPPPSSPVHSAPALQSITVAQAGARAPGQFRAAAQAPRAAAEPEPAGIQVLGKSKKSQPPEGEECAICQEHMRAEGAAFAPRRCQELFCGHWFHAKCLIQQCEGANFHCAVCREPIDKMTIDLFGGDVAKAEERKRMEDEQRYYSDQRESIRVAQELDRTLNSTDWMRTPAGVNDYDYASQLQHDELSGLAEELGMAPASSSSAGMRASAGSSGDYGLAFQLQRDEMRGASNDGASVEMPGGDADDLDYVFRLQQEELRGLAAELGGGEHVAGALDNRAAAQLLVDGEAQQRAFWQAR